MKTSLIVITFISCLTLSAQDAVDERATKADTLTPLTGREADAIVEEQALRQTQREANRLVNRVDFQVMERKAVTIDGRRLILNRVAPPQLQPAIERPQVDEPADLPEDLEAEIERRKAKPSLALHLVGRVIDGEFTEITWRDGGKEYVAYSNVDFTLFGGMVDFETDEAFYSVLVSATNTTREQIREQRRFAKEQEIAYTPRRIPSLPPFNADQAEYVIFGDQEELRDQEYVLKPLDAMHVYFDQYEETLRIQQQRVTALREARQRYEEAHPETPEDTVINFWPVRGSAYLKPNR